MWPDGRVEQARIYGGDERSLRAHARAYMAANVSPGLWRTFEESMFSKPGTKLLTGIMSTSVDRWDMGTDGKMLDWETHLPLP